jgi:hypothetical protein
MKKYFLFFFPLFTGVYLQAQENAVAESELYPLLRQTFNDSNAYKTVAFVEQRWRLAGNSGFNESIFYVENILKQAGYIKEINGEADGPLTYRIESREMKKPTWEPIDASLTIEGESLSLLNFASNRNMLAINSANTPPEGITAELLYVDKAGLKDLHTKDWKGKIVFAETNIAALYRMAIAQGAIGVLAYSVSDYNQPALYTHSIQFQDIPYSASGNQHWGILLSYDAKEKLKAALAKGKTRVSVKVSSKIYNAVEYTLVANVRGRLHPDERFVCSAHVQEPGANDNASGVGTLAEMARTTAQLIKENKFAAQRSITFLWGDEIVSTARYIGDDSVRARGIKWGLSLDMVGEDVDKTGGSFLIEKMPDPSAIWTRGNDKHTEWGGRVLKESELFPHYFNDYLLNRCRYQASDNGWKVNCNPFEGGSDHTPFLEAKIPGLLMWHFTDVFYHTDADRLNMVSAKEMKNVGVSALAAAFGLVSANEQTTIQLIEEIKGNALDRLSTEFQLSKNAIKHGAAINKEQHIIDVWADWYKQAIGKMQEIPVTGTSKKIQGQIKNVQLIIEQKNTEINKALQSKF